MLLPSPYAHNSRRENYIFSGTNDLVTNISQRRQYFAHQYRQLNFALQCQLSISLYLFLGLLPGPFLSSALDGRKGRVNVALFSASSLDGTLVDRIIPSKASTATEQEERERWEKEAGCC